MFVIVFMVLFSFLILPRNLPGEVLEILGNLKQIRDLLLIIGGRLRRRFLQLKLSTHFLDF